VCVCVCVCVCVSHVCVCVCVNDFLTVDAVTKIADDVKLQNDPNVYSTLISWQSSLLWQILPATMLGENPRAL
jgi:hypothetical protein